MSALFAALLIPLLFALPSRAVSFETEETLEKTRLLYENGAWCAAASESEKLFAAHADTAAFHVNEGLFRDAWYRCAITADERDVSIQRKVRAARLALAEKPKKDDFELFVLASTPTEEGAPYDEKALREIIDRFPQTPSAVWADFILAAGLRGEPSKVEEFLARNLDSRLAPTAKIILGNLLWLSPETIADAIARWKEVRRDSPSSILDYYTAGERLLNAGEKIPSGEREKLGAVLDFYMPREGSVPKITLSELKKKLGER